MSTCYSNDGNFFLDEDDTLLLIKITEREINKYREGVVEGNPKRWKDLLDTLKMHLEYLRSSS